MKLFIVGAALVVTSLTSCSSTTPNDTGVTSTTMPVPSDSSSNFQFEPSETALAVSKAVIGMTQSEAIETIEEISSEQLTPRVIRLDGENYAVTMDYQLSRINLEIDNGIVTKATIG